MAYGNPCAVQVDPIEKKPFFPSSNVPGHGGKDTYCHNCGKPVIARRGYQVGETPLKQGICTHCGTGIPGLWQRPQA